METLHQPGDIILQRYRVIGRLGQGTMGTTYQAEDLNNSQQVAIKAVSLYQAQDWKILELFVREAKVLSVLKHPAIPQYLHYFQIDTPTDRRFYLVQELIVGDSLADLAQQGWRASESEAKQIAQQILNILIYLHRLNPPVIHRDIKPQNIIRRPDGKVFLVDFGAVQDVYRNTLTCGGTFVGTLGYMPLEQFRGQVGWASDLYSLGATLLFLLTRQAPDQFPQRQMKIDFRAQVKVSTGFAEWLEKMLEPALEDRFRTAQEALSGLQDRWENRLISPQKPPKGRRLTCQATADRLIVKLPPPWGDGCAGVILLMIFTSLLIPALIALIQHSIRTWVEFVSSGVTEVTIEYWAISLFLLFVVLPLGLLVSYVLIASRCFRLEITPATFRVQWRYCFGFRHQVRGRTQDIEQVVLQQSQLKLNDKSPPPKVCTLVEGVRTYSFGICLTPGQQQWLVQEISLFLSRAQS